jgi:hypothetical protein
MHGSFGREKRQAFQTYFHDTTRVLEVLVYADGLREQPGPIRTLRPAPLGET